MTNSREVGCFCFGCAIGVAAALAMAPASRQRATKYLRRKAIRGVDYARKHVETAREVADEAAAKAGKIIDRVVDGLDAAKDVIASVERLRQH